MGKATKKMYLCTKCGMTFDTSEAGWTGSYEGEGVMRGWLPDEMVCPCCGSPEWVEAAECGDCGDYFDIDEMHMVDGWHICEECYQKIEKAGVASTD